MKSKFRKLYISGPFKLSVTHFLHQNRDRVKCFYVELFVHNVCHIFSWSHTHNGNEKQIYLNLDHITSHPEIISVAAIINYVISWQFCPFHLTSILIGSCEWCSSHISQTIQMIKIKKILLRVSTSLVQWRKKKETFKKSGK